MILTDEKLLRTKCEDVLPDEVDGLRLQLEAELAASAERGQPGIGLAAPQIGIFKKMAIIRVPGGGKMHSVDLVNCRIKEFYDRTLFDGEGCLSFPGQEAKTYRFQEILVVDNLVAPHSFVATGLVAVCIQHELDHLRGVLLPDVAIAEPNKPLPQKVSSAFLDQMPTSIIGMKRNK